MKMAFSLGADLQAAMFKSWKSPFGDRLPHFRSGDSGPTIGSHTFIGGGAPNGRMNDSCENALSLEFRL
jgi:hypothetical protein